MNAATTSRIIMSFIDNGPFLEENDISRQVDKSIYMKDQVDDGQTQCTGQAMVPLAAMRTELKIVSISIEDNCNTSDIISLSPSEVQLSFNTNSNNYLISETYDESLL